MQSQEFAPACWSLGLRTAGLSLADVRAEFDRGAFLRTHILRPTWHFVAPADLRWMLTVTAPRVHRLNAGYCRREGLDQATLDRGASVIMDALRGGAPLTRPELTAALAAEGIVVAGLALACLVMHAELEALICSGPMRGTQPTYALFDGRVPHSAPGTLADLVLRFFAGHGPASVKDFCRWSSLTVAQANAGLGEVADRLVCVEVEGSTLWSDPAAPTDGDFAAALLLPLYDEATLSYPVINFPTAPDHPLAPVSLSLGSVILDGTNVATWHRRVQGRRLIMRVDPVPGLAPGLAAGQRAAVEAAAEQLAVFLGLGLDLQWGREPIG